MTNTQLDANGFPVAVIQATQLAYAKRNIWSSLQVAQWILESGRGKHQPVTRDDKGNITEYSHNYFGVKAAAGQPFLLAATHETIKGEDVPIIAKFRKYANDAEGFDDHARLLAVGKPYAKFQPLIKAGDVFEYIKAFSSTYATANGYGDMLISLITRFKLQQYDVKVSPAKLPGHVVPIAGIVASAGVLTANLPRVVHHFDWSPIGWTCLGIGVGTAICLAIGSVVNNSAKRRMLNLRQKDNHIMAVLDSFQPAIQAAAALKAKADSADAAVTAQAAVQTQLDAANAQIQQLTAANSSGQQNDTDTLTALNTALGVAPAAAS